MIKILLDNDLRFRTEARYTFEAFFEIIGITAAFIENQEQLHKGDILVYYGKSQVKADCGVLILPETDWLKCQSIAPSLKFISGTPVIYWIDSSRKQPINFTRENTYCEAGFDIIAASFYFLSRREEIINKERDCWGCFPADFSIAYKWRILHMPVINIYIEIIQKALADLSYALGSEFKIIQRWKDNRRFAAVLTHDVDNLRKYTFDNGIRKLIRGKEGFKNAFYDIGRSFLRDNTKDPYWSFDSFVALERQIGASSTFYIISESKNRRYDPYYSLNAELKRQLHDLSVSGWDIGLHGSYDSFNNKDVLKKEKDILEKALGRQVFGTRQHYLRFSVEHTSQVQEQAGFKHDSTLGYNEDIGFRAGLAAPFFPYDSQNKKRSDILELPLAIMDGSLFNSRQYSKEEAFKKSVELIDQVESVGGLVVILWHNKAGDAKEFPGWWETYARIVNHLYVKGAWIANASELAEWWLDRVKRCAV